MHLTTQHQKSPKIRRSKYCSQGAPVIVTISHGIERFNARTVFSKRESNPDTTCQRLVFLPDSVYVALFLTYFGVLGHILRRGKIVVISSVLIGVEGRYKWCQCATKIIPWCSFEEGM